MRILFVTGSLVHGGAERHSITLMNRLAERGHECHAVYVKNDPSQRERIRLAPGGSVHCLDARGYWDMAAVCTFAEHLRRLRPDALVAANGYALLYASLARLRARWQAPLMATFHTTELPGLKEQIKLAIERPCFWNADCAVFVCDRQRQHWRRRALSARRNRVIHNGVDTEHFRDRWSGEARRALRREHGLADTDFVIGISAVLRPEKNHVQLVEALAELRGRGIAARLLVIGDGPTRPLVEARARALNVAAALTITGFQQDVRPWLAMCDVTALCSLAVETFSLAALEAMAMARPVVHADIGGAAEMIFPGYNGLLFPPGDTRALGAALTDLVERQRAREMGAHARKMAEVNFSEGAMIDRYERLLLELCGRMPQAIRQERRENHGATVTPIRKLGGS